MKQGDESEIQEIVDRAIPVFKQGGLSGALYLTDDPEDADGYAIDIHDWKRLKELLEAGMKQGDRLE